MKYSIKRFSLKEDYLEALDDTARLERKHPKLTKGPLFGEKDLEADKEILETRRTDGPKASARARRRGLMLAPVYGVGGGIIGGMAGGKKGRAKRALAGAAIGSGIGYTTGWANSKVGDKSLNSKIGDKIYKRERWLDNMKVADGEMTEAEFDKKWKKKR